jgi:hypothetical protein
MKQKTPENRFKQVAELRVNKVLMAIESLSKCSSRNYKYNHIMIKRMFGAIRSSLEDCENLFNSKGKNNINKFKF